MSLLLLAYPPCSTCQKAKKWLDDQGITYTDRHILTQCPSAAELRHWHQVSGLELRRFFNTSGMQYRQLGLKDKLPQMSEEEQYQLLASSGMLIKRPLLIGAGWVIPGFHPAKWAKQLGIAHE